MERGGDQGAGAAKNLTVSQVPRVTEAASGKNRVRARNRPYGAQSVKVRPRLAAHSREVHDDDPVRPRVGRFQHPARAQKPLIAEVERQNDPV